MLKGLEGVSSHTSRVAIPVLDNDQDLRSLRSAAEPHLGAAPYGLLIAGHGLYAWGKDLGTARRHLEILEFLLEQHWRQLLLQALAPRTPRLQRHGLRWVLLDIEGTTCPVSFVAGELFPYAAEQMGALLLARQGDLEVQALVAAVDTAWEQDPDPQAQALRQRDPADVLTYLQWLIREDRKMTPLKELQGLVWEQGYRSGALRGPPLWRCPTSPAALEQRWSTAGGLLIGLCYCPTTDLWVQQCWRSSPPFQRVVRHTQRSEAGSRKLPQHRQPTGGGSRAGAVNQRCQSGVPGRCQHGHAGDIQLPRGQSGAKPREI